MTKDIRTGLIEKRNEMSAPDIIDYCCFIAEKLGRLVPCKWDRIVLHACETGEYSSARFFFYNEEGELHYCEDIPVEYGVNQEELDVLLKELMEINRKLLLEEECAQWNSFTFYLDSDMKFKIKFAQNEGEGSEPEKELLWALLELGAVPADRYRQGILKAYLKAHEYTIPDAFDDDEEDVDYEEEAIADDSEERIGFFVDFEYYHYEDIVVNPYVLIFGNELGNQMDEVSERMSEINEQGSLEENKEEYTKLAERFQELMALGGGVEVIKAYSDQESKKYGLKEAWNQYYYEPMERERKAGLAKEAREQAAVKRFEEYGILPEWYNFESIGQSVVFYDGMHVYWRGRSKSVYCSEPEKAYEIMLDRLRRYKKTYEFEKSEATFYVDKIKVLSSENGYFNGYTGKKYLFTESSVDGERDEELLKNGYHFRSYDQYQGHFLYAKETDNSVFEQLCLQCEIKIAAYLQQSSRDENSVFKVKLIYDIPDKLREKILSHIKLNKNDLEIENYELYEEIIEYFTEERLQTDAIYRFNDIGK